MTGIFRRGMRDRPKHDRKLCLRCKYHGTVGSREDKMYNVCCDYAALAHDGTCLRREHGVMIDRRGEDFESCKLFKEGEALGRAEVNKKVADEAYRKKMREAENDRRGDQGDHQADSEADSPRVQERGADAKDE